MVPEAGTSPSVWRSRADNGSVKAASAAREAAWAAAVQASLIANQGPACTAAAILIALGALARDLGQEVELPPLATATLALGARAELTPPGNLDYIAPPGRPSRLDRRVEALAASIGLPVRCRSELPLMVLRPRPRPGEALVCHLAWGQEEPGRTGFWGFHPLRPSTYSTGGHTVVVVAERDRGWLVGDPNHPTLQVWPRPGLAVVATRIRPVIPAGSGSQPGAGFRG